jgi:hypothetical protein
MTGEYSAAIRLEEYWNRILIGLNARLFCAYPIDVFGPEFDAGGVHAILCDHTHLLPCDETGILEGALGRAMSRVLGDAWTAKWEFNGHTHPGWGSVPEAERMILWVRANFPYSAREILRIASEEYRERTSSRTC